MRYAFVIFDFDGTLVDTRLPITRSVSRTLDAAGFAPREATEIQALIGLPLGEVLRRAAGLPDEPDPRQVAALCAQYRVVFQEMSPHEAPLYEGVRAMLEAVRDAGVEMAVATSRSRASLEQFLDQLDLRASFSFLAGGQCVDRGKPHPEMLEFVLGRCGRRTEEALLIGDTTFDMEMGKAARMHTCAVTYGMHGAATLQAAQPTYLVHGAHELTGIVLPRT